MCFIGVALKSKSVVANNVTESLHVGNEKERTKQRVLRNTVCYCSGEDEQLLMEMFWDLMVDKNQERA